MTKHTAGPWAVYVLEDKNRFSLPNGPIYQVLAMVKNIPSTVCVLEDAKEIPGYTADLEADARLIAAAPDLLEALKYCRQKIEYMQTNGEWYSPGRAIDMADAAIAKATGEQA